MSLIKQQKRSPVNSGGATEKWTNMIKTQGESRYEVFTQRYSKLWNQG